VKLRWRKDKSPANTAQTEPGPEPEAAQRSTICPSSTATVMVAPST
jgi:hypothetical protein